MTEEIRTKIKRKRTICDAKSGKRKSFPLSLTPGLKDVEKIPTITKIIRTK